MNKRYISLGEETLPLLNNDDDFEIEVVSDTHLAARLRDMYIYTASLPRWKL